MTEGGARRRGALYGSLLLDRPEHAARVAALRAFVDPPGPVNLEIGVDTGAVLIDQARTFPDERWIGLEIRRRKVERARPHAPGNALLWALDARTLLAGPLLTGRLSRIDILFPTPFDDPRKRLFSPAFAEDCARALAPGGRLTVLTDVAPLWAEIEPLLAGWSPAAAPPRGEARSRRERVCRREGIAVLGGTFSPGSARTPG